ncbi:WD40 repeat-containing protein HOS15-like [Phoenix dactylifera]|uniref:WD40 repeat-containing protein HOS15-like n=1 Tax=Phoenix dactylifera TaxID=42345 RepID=A0A8B7BX34_PHODC|nr:WD40 repeat-containing protein HOS15-like [Phoenix dactylifera]
MALNSVTPVELDILVYRYLQDKGYTHAAFAFDYESGINKIPIENDLVLSGSLVALVEKGLENLELEANLGKQMPLEAERNGVPMEVDEMQSMWREKMQEIDGYIKLGKRYSELEQRIKDIKLQLVALLRSGDGGAPPGPPA